MKYKVIEYNSDVREEQTGTCDLCFDTAEVNDWSWLDRLVEEYDKEQEDE